MTTTARSLLAMAFLTIGLLGWSGGAAHADPPLDVRSDITDSAGVLGDDTVEVQRALDEFTDATGFQLYVVYVETFDGLSGAAWADRTAIKSAIGTTDILLAVATKDRRYGIAVPTDQTISDDALKEVELDEIRPRLTDDDWAGAAIAAAEGYTQAAEGGRLPWAGIVIAGLMIAGAGAFAVHRLRGNYEETHEIRDEHGQPVDSLSGLSTVKLNSRASAALVAIDDALTTSEQELGFAEAQFGTDATRDFARAIAEGRESVRTAFGLRQRLDDAEPETEAEVRQMAAEIVHLCHSVDEALDKHAADFDELRDLQARAPDVLANLAVRVDEIASRLPRSRTTLGQLSTSHPAASLASVTNNADLAEALVGSARSQTELGSAALEGNDRASAVTHARAAEDSAAQATTLLDAVERAEADLAAAPRRISERLTSLQLDIDDATRLAADDAGIVAATTSARAAINVAGRPDRDPLAAAAGLEREEARLDELLAPVRAGAAEAAKERLALTDSLGRVTSRVAAVTDFVETRRGAVGAEARTRLSEAARHLDRAQRLLGDDPDSARTALQESEGFADQAERLARHDVDTWERRHQTASSGSLESMVLGGILVDSTPRHSPGTVHKPGTRRGPGSFGGSATRGRRGGGGRF